MVFDEDVLIVICALKLLSFGVVTTDVGLAAVDERLAVGEDERMLVATGDVDILSMERYCVFDVVCVFSDDDNVVSLSITVEDSDVEGNGIVES